MIRNSVTKIIVLMMIIGLNWTGLSAVVQTIAYYNDTEDSTANSYTAGILDFILESPSDFSPSPIVLGESATRNITFINNGNIPKYTVNATSFVGVLCDYLDLEASLDAGPVLYSGKLTDFTYGPVVFENPENWLFTLTLPADAPEIVHGESCQFKFVFFGSQIKNDLPFGQGFNDTEEITNNISANGTGGPLSPVINKVYYYPDSNHGDCTYTWVSALREWKCLWTYEWKYELVEIYNPADEAVNISGWKICDNQSCDVIPASAPIPSQGFALIAATSSAWSYWDIPAGVVKIALNGYIGGNGLDNSADMLMLIDDVDFIVDQMNWGTPNTSWPNYNSNVWNPGVAPVSTRGYALARVPTGFDTDQPSDWKSLGTPSVTVSNIGGPLNFCGLCKHTGTYYCAPALLYGSSLMINWNAINPNGPNSDLLIDILYITDNDCNGVISNSDNKYVVAENLSNPASGNGNYYWSLVGPYFYGKIWIKILATGPENFLAQNYALSNAAFEPLESEIVMVCSEETGECWLEAANPEVAGEGCYAGEVALPTEEDTTGITANGGITISENPVAETETSTTTEEEIPTTDEETLIEENSTTTEETSTTTEENSTTTEEGSVTDTINEVVDGIINEIVEEILPGEPATDEPVSEETSIEETPVVDETATMGEAPVDEILVIEETPVIEEQSVIAPVDNNSGEQAPPIDNSSGGGDSETNGSSPDNNKTLTDSATQ